MMSENQARTLRHQVRIISHGRGDMDDAAQSVELYLLEYSERNGAPPPNLNIRLLALKVCRKLGYTRRSSDACSRTIGTEPLDISASPGLSPEGWAILSQAAETVGCDVISHLTGCETLDEVGARYNQTREAARKRGKARLEELR